MVGVEKGVWNKVNPFKGMINLSVVQIDDFKLIIRFDFLRETRAIVLLYEKVLMMVGNKPYIISIVSSQLNKRVCRPSSLRKDVNAISHLTYVPFSLRRWRSQCQTLMW